VSDVSVMEQLKIDRPRILIIEDEGHRAGELAHRLDGEGYETTIARNQDDGVWQAHKLSPDLIILDMPLADRLNYAGSLATAKPRARFPS